jgi:hypothetical protein
MNPYLYTFLNFGIFYNIVDNKFDNIFVQNATEITTEQFVQIFDKKETEPHICKYCQAETTQDDETCYAKPTEWQPQRGDRVLVWDGNEKNAKIRIFLTKIEGSTNPIVVVYSPDEESFLNNEEFDTTEFKHMKPLPTEQPKETDFKTKVIELIEKRIAICIESIDEYKKLNSFSACEIWKNCKHENQELLNKIKQL